MPVGVHHDTDGSLVPAASAAPRALVLLSVPWSGPERIARLQFHSAVDRLSGEYPGLGIEFFSLNEETNACQAWLSSFGIAGLGTGFPLGAGSLLWLERGQLVLSEIHGAGLKAAEIIARSLELWPLQFEQSTAANRERP